MKLTASKAQKRKAQIEVQVMNILKIYANKFPSSAEHLSSSSILLGLETSRSTLSMLVWCEHMARRPLTDEQQAASLQ